MLSNLPSQSVERIVFCEKNTGSPKFHVDMTGDMEAALSRAASLLALGCMASGESPSNYAIWVPAQSTLTERIIKHAEDLLHVGRSFFAGVELSPREHEVLKELLNHRVNKEIAERLSISVRTVKFHVSSLLAKFGVSSRWDLVQRARHMLHTHEVAEGFSKLQSGLQGTGGATGTETSAPYGSQPSAQSNSKRSKQTKQVSRILQFRRKLRPA